MSSAPACCPTGMSQVTCQISDLARRLRRRARTRASTTRSAWAGCACTSGRSRPTAGASSMARGRRAQRRRRGHRGGRRGHRRLHHGPQHVRPRPGRVGPRLDAAGGARTRRTTRPSSCSPTTRASRSRWRAARRSTSSPTASSRRSSRRARRPATRTSRSPAARARCSQYLAAGLLDELHLHIVPIAARRRRAAARRTSATPTLEPVEVVASPAVTHVKYRVARSACISHGARGSTWPVSSRDLRLDSTAAQPAGRRPARPRRPGPRGSR